MSSEGPELAVEQAPRPADAGGPRPAIRVAEVGKCYQVYARPQDRLWQAFFRGRRNFYREFWALAGVNMDVLPGETVGIIGRNGSGKSTLLQVICGTLTPTTGRVETLGRVAALLELGAAFHPDFTGRENVYLNARILGLSRPQTDERFARIAAFADIGAFIEQPVKTYSSGMYVRLAFSVAANVDADILVIDEALAVGDVFFRAKCMRFLRGFKERGGTVLFVSHDASAVLSLCDRAVWLDSGKVRLSGAAKSVCEGYFAEEVGASNRERQAAPAGGAVECADHAPALALETIPVRPLRPGVEAIGQGGAQVLGVDVRNMEGRELVQVTGQQRVKLRVHFRAIRALERPIVGFYINDRLGQNLFGENTTAVECVPPMEAGAERVAGFTFDMPVLRAEQYTVTVAVAEGTMASHTRHHWIHEAYALTADGRGSGGTGLVGIPMRAVEFRVPGKDEKTP